jgi:hypothetical protein
MYYNNINAIWNEKQEEIINFKDDSFIEDLLMLPPVKAFKKIIDINVNKIDRTIYSQFISAVEQIVYDLRKESENATNLGVARKYFNMVEKLTDKFNL